MRLFSETFPYCRLLGMSEEQFWRANPRIIKTWEKAFRQRTEHQNFMNYILGAYILDAVYVGVGKNLHGRKFKGAYPDKPVRVFPMTEEEKRVEEEKALQKAIAFFDAMEAKGEKTGR